LSLELVEGFENNHQGEKITIFLFAIFLSAIFLFAESGTGKWRTEIWRTEIWPGYKFVIAGFV
jgi:hypothetical protein